MKPHGFLREDASVSDPDVPVPSPSATPWYRSVTFYRATIAVGALILATDAAVAFVEPARWWQWGLQAVLAVNLIVTGVYRSRRAR